MGDTGASLPPPGCDQPSCGQPFAPGGADRIFGGQGDDGILGEKGTHPTESVKVVGAHEEGGPMADARQVGADFVAAFNAHDEDRIRELNAENAVVEAPGDVRVEGRDAATQFAMAWLNAFPDARLTVHNELVSGDWVVQEFTFEGTHEDTMTSPGGDIPATHRRLKGRGVQVFRIEGDAVADTRLYYDQVQIMTQLGLMPEGATA